MLTLPLDKAVTRALIVLGLFAALSASCHILISRLHGHGALDTAFTAILAASPMASWYFTTRFLGKSTGWGHPLFATTFALLPIGWAIALWLT
jgi:hypothetical protein